jgi:hypothetical protein
MPAVSKSQQRLFAAAEHGATFPLARKIRAQLSRKQMHDFASTKRQNLPDRIRSPKPKVPKAAAKQFLHASKVPMGRLYTPTRHR